MKMKKNKTPQVAIYLRVGNEAQITQQQQRDLVLEHYLKLAKK